MINDGFFTFFFLKYFTEKNNNKSDIKKSDIFFPLDYT